ncbi:hypothetical protein SAMD00019534_010200 [Acytostelium subglobosum LB1]|uniref:hypothetical protein n=1 Tax=Acytostelium subglobosum LB1 TaxID=1410327 RepID=UPI000644913C|nr:hypothetical protein SAMD00019534_010200 [Acytostelium subglobosum LB1]GAM17845.1 hypothetical protein SAMD00019534_010200 [Acytostelium subglobosum LB1]|eukprot:XP_012758441.1 hypothetical protein SAMD00019534_010200 [Acytostelium subglobosum LB1]
MELERLLMLMRLLLKTSHYYTNGIHPFIVLSNISLLQRDIEPSKTRDPTLPC